MSIATQVWDFSCLAVVAGPLAAALTRELISLIFHLFLEADMFY
jgi:hypothetical protein